MVDHAQLFCVIRRSIGEDCLEFEPTGMFTSDIQSSEPQNETTKDEFTEELLTDEVDLDEVLVFEDDVTEPLEVTEPIVKETGSSFEASNQESTKETTIEAILWLKTILISTMSRRLRSMHPCTHLRLKNFNPRGYRSTTHPSRTPSQNTSSSADIEEDPIPTFRSQPTAEDSAGGIVFETR